MSDMDTAPEFIRYLEQQAGKRLPELRRFYNSSALLQGGKQKMTVAERKAESRRKAIRNCKKVPCIATIKRKNAKSHTRVTCGKFSCSVRNAKKGANCRQVTQRQRTGPRSCRPSECIGLWKRRLLKIPAG